MNRLPLRTTLAAMAMSTLVTAPSPGQGFRDVQIKTTAVAEGVYMLEGRGGNIGVSVGPDGVFMIDDQFAPLTGKIQAAVAELSDKPIRFVLNTHWHGDHTGGNENLGEAGSVIVAHDNVRKRMSVEQFMEAFSRTVPASPLAALPVITFADSVTFHLNGDEIQVFHVPAAHTDGDSIVHFKKADVLHMGDTFFNGTYPFIDVGSGGSIEGVIVAAEASLLRTGPGTRIIPGHGPLATVDDLRAYRRMLMTVRDAVAKMRAAGKSRDDVIAAKPTADLDEQWGGGFMSPDQFVGLVYDGMGRKQASEPAAP
jgi:glyoxylase-like metal-dependent hydrolase (beta-lactamase superfamily II)